MGLVVKINLEIIGRVFKHLIITKLQMCVQLFNFRLGAALPEDAFSSQVLGMDVEIVYQFIDRPANLYISWKSELVHLSKIFAD